MSERIVYKYRLAPGIGTIEAKGSNARPLHVGAIDDEVYLWVEHDTIGETVLLVDTMPTEITFRPRVPFLGTVFLYRGTIVFHIYAGAS